MEHLIPFFCHRALMADKLCLARFPLGPIVLIQEQDHVTTHFACNAYVHRMNGSCRTFDPLKHSKCLKCHHNDTLDTLDNQPSTHCAEYDAYDEYDAHIRHIHHIVRSEPDRKENQK